MMVPDTERLVGSRTDRNSPVGIDPPLGDKDKPLDGATDTEPAESYHRRWYILGVFAALCFIQGLIWNTWGPVAASSEAVFGWVDADIALLSNWGPISFLISTIGFAWLLDVKGLRLASLVTALVVAAGAALRCITSQTPAATWLIHTGQFLNGLGGPVVMGAPPLLSATWFPVSQRTTATAIVTVVNVLGTAVAFVIGPLLVPAVSTHHGHAINISSVTNGSSQNQSIAWVPLDNATSEISQAADGIMKLMYIEFGMAAAVLVLMLIYFPSKPPSAPSITATIGRTEFKKGVLQLIRHRQFWMLAAPYGISSGVFAGFGSVLDVNLKPQNISQNTAGWIGFYGSIGSTVGGFTCAWFADIFKRRLKLYMIVLFTLALVSFVLFSCAVQDYIPLSDAILYTTYIIGSFSLGATPPLFYELTCESTYPIAEGLTNSFLTWINNLTGLIFLLILMVPSLGTIWMNWFLVGSILVAIPILCVFREDYTRLDIDTASKLGSTNS